MQPAAAPHALVARIPLAFGLAVYRAIDTVAPAAYVNDALATTALAQGDLRCRAALRACRCRRASDATTCSAKLPQRAVTTVLAREYYFAADDVAAVQRAIAELARTDSTAQSRLEARLRERLMSLGTHPDAVAESYFISANYEVWLRRYLDRARAG